MQCEPSPERQEPPVLDTGKRYIRVTRKHENGFIEFDFAIGDPDVFVELILDTEAFQDFCSGQQAEAFPAPDEAQEDLGDWNWRLADARETGFKHT